MRVVVVTGASSGIGKSVALQAAAQKDHVVLVARDAPELKAVAAECEDAGAASATVASLDVGDDAAVSDRIDDVVRRFGRVDAVVNCAGVVAFGDAAEVPHEIFDKVIQTNLIGSANVARHALRAMRERGEGNLVLVGSLLAHITATEMTPYVVSKWGVRALARQLQQENRDLSDVHISYIAPAGVDTPIWAQAANYTGSAGRPPPLSEQPEKVARVILDRLEHPRPRTQVGLPNDLLRFGFSVLPALYDAVVGPAMRYLARDIERDADPLDGNVLDPDPRREQLHGDYDGIVGRIGRQLLAPLRGSRS
jgi:short-subunit dehydrogenase